MHLKVIVDVIGKDYVAVAGCFSLWWGIKFFVSFHDVKEKFPRMNTVCNIVLCTVFVSAVMMLFTSNMRFATEPKKDLKKIKTLLGSCGMQVHATKAAITLC